MMGYPSADVAVMILMSFELVAGDKPEMSDVILSLSMK